MSCSMYMGAIDKYLSLTDSEADARLLTVI